MKYANQENMAVICNHPFNGEQWTVPRGHRFWAEFGIDLAEQENRVEEADPQPQPELAQ